MLRPVELEVVVPSVVVPVAYSTSPTVYEVSPVPPLLAAMAVPFHVPLVMVPTVVMDAAPVHVPAVMEVSAPAS